jgi:hypothetical protein
MCNTTGGSDWSESATAVEVRAMIEEWKKEKLRGAMLLYAVQAMITEDFLNTMSPRSCKILRRFLVVQDVHVNVRLAYPQYPAILDLLRINRAGKLSLLKPPPQNKYLPMRVEVRARNTRRNLSVHKRWTAKTHRGPKEHHTK